MLCTQYIDTAIEAQVYKLFGQQKSEDRIRYIASELASKFIALYKTCRNLPTEKSFNDTYSALLDRAQRDEAILDTRTIDADDKVNKIVRPIELNKYVSDNNKNTRQYATQRSTSRYIKRSALKPRRTNYATIDIIYPLLAKVLIQA